MRAILFNPFKRYAGSTALLAGLAVILLTSLVAWTGQIHLDGVIDLHLGSSITFPQALGEGLLNFLSMSVICYLTALTMSGTRTRAIDIFGTQALARAPFLLACLVSVLAMDEKVIRYLEYTYLNKGTAVELSVPTVILFALASLVTLFCIVWMVLLMYRAYSVSANLKGAKAVISFIAALIIAEVLSKLLIHQIIV